MPIAAIVAATALSACAGQRVPFLTAEVPDEIRSEPAEAYPNINLAPDRPARTMHPRRQRALERELEALRERHVREAEEAIESSGRRM